IVPPWPRTPPQRQPAGGSGQMKSAGFSPCLVIMVEARLRADAASPGVQPFAVVLASRARILWMWFLAVLVVMGVVRARMADDGALWNRTIIQRRRCARHHGVQYG